MTIIEEMSAEIEQELKRQILQVNNLSGLSELKAMMEYHLGWEGEGAGPDAQGKRIRPLLTTLCTAACGEDWRRALPAAAGIELIHNFSLLHDDIEDNSHLRRGRPTVWKIWGIHQAINTGDAMFSLAHLSLYDLDPHLTPETILKCSELLQKTCLELTQGQFLDIAQEDQNNLSLDAYWQMIKGKTAALVACSCEIGALAGRADIKKRKHYFQFGLNLGLAFQVLDDILGIWGDTQTIGKSTEGDLATGKKTLPILYGLQKQGKFFQLWETGRIPLDKIEYASQILVEEGAKEFSREHAARLTNQALESLASAEPKGSSGQELHNLTLRLLNRQN